MKPILILLIVATTSLSFAGVDKDILPENQVILSGSWNPTVDEISKALSATQRFLEKPTNINEWQKEEIQKILSNSSKYRVQFSCVLEDGKKLIRCNFIPTGENFSEWKDHMIFVCDGGFWFWQIDYDVGNDQCLNFRSNGYA